MLWKNSAHVSTVLMSRFQLLRMTRRLLARIWLTLVVIGIAVADMAASFRPLPADQLHPNRLAFVETFFGTRVSDKQQMQKEKRFPVILSALPYFIHTESHVQLYEMSAVTQAGSVLPQDNLAQPQKTDHHLSRGALTVIIVVPVCVCVIVISSFIFWICKKSSTRNQVPTQHYLETQLPDRILSIGPWMRQFNSSRISIKVDPICELDYEELQAATGNFSSTNVLGRGGFGCVYKAQLDENILAAVKKLDGDDKHIDQEFHKEIDLTSKMRHENLVSLLGFCIHGQEHFLVYELMQNGSLEEQLHGPSQGCALTWHLRMKIALDSAKGLEYLHEHCNPPVIHRDFKSSNILLDSRFNAKLSDFGLAVQNPGTVKDHDCELQGTFGYVAPEYILDGALSEKNDVYAFGVVLLELITGRTPIDKTMPTGCQSLVTWATPQLTDRQRLPQIIDSVIMDSVNLTQLYQVAAVAALCVQTDPGYRPLITDVVQTLIPLVPVELGGTFRTLEPGDEADKRKSFSFSSSISRANAVSNNVECN
eukprot:c27260_g1_i1 orf=164-1774(-)